MGLFGNKSKGRKEFVARLKDEPDFMLKVLNLFDGDPNIGEVNSAVKKMGYDMSVLDILVAIKEAGEYYQSMGGGASGGGVLAGFSQDDPSQPAQKPSSGDDEILMGFKQVSGSTAFSEVVASGSDKGGLRAAENAAEQFFLDMIGNDPLHKKYEAIISDKDVKLGAIVEKLHALGYEEVDVLDFVSVIKALEFQYDDDTLRRFFKK